MNKNTLACYIVCLLSLSAGGSFAQSLPSVHYIPKPYEVSAVEESVISLNGSWLFQPAPKQGFFNRPAIRKEKWSDIVVPGEWVMQGHQVAPGSSAAYARLVNIPADWKGKVIMIRFDAVYSLARVFLNGKLVGQHEGGFTPFECNLTDAAKPGKSNELILSVQNESLADTLASASQYAAHPLGGITRKAEMFALPKIHVSRWELTADLDDDFKNALLISEVEVGGIQNTDQGIGIKLLMRDPRSGQTIMEKRIFSPDPDPEADKVLRMSVPVIHPALWDPEHPNLYDVFLLLEKDGMVISKYTCKFGFREISVAGNRLFLNGMPLKLRGVNRHEVHPLKGRSLSRDEWLTDVTLFKEANVNYIRTSHYPPAEEFVAICDSIGILLECEAPICWMGHGANEYWKDNNPHDEKYYALVRQQVMETVAQYRNHPSVILWSLANESAWGPTWEKILNEIEEADPDRPVSFHDQSYGAFNNFGSQATRIANIHYPGPTGPKVAQGFDRPLLFGEYVHLNTYNRREVFTDPGLRDAWGRGLQSMWEDMYYSAGCLGGAVWSGIDDIFLLPDGSAVGYGEWGILDGWRRPKPEYWHLKKTYSPIKIVARTYEVPEPNEPILVAVENRHLFSDLSELDVRWRMDGLTGTGQVTGAPGQTALLRIDCGQALGQESPLELDFWSPGGYLLDQYKLLPKVNKINASSDQIQYVKPELMVLERTASVVHGTTEWVFDAPSGKLRTVISDHVAILTDGPELFLIPLSADPCSPEYTPEIEPLNDHCKNWKGKITATGRDGDHVFIEVAGAYDEAELQLRYLFQSNGKLIIDYEVIPKKDVNPRQIGLVFTMPGEFSQLQWERVGQWSVYPDNHPGRPSGTAVPFTDSVLPDNTRNEMPVRPWEQDSHVMGSNDFRATRDHLIWASLSNTNGKGVRMHSDGTGAFRAWIHNSNIRFLGAAFSTAGGDPFFSSHLTSERQPLKSNESWKGQLILSILK